MQFQGMETRSFRRDTVEEDLPEGVPYGVKAASRAGAGLELRISNPMAMVISVLEEHGMDVFIIF